MTATTDPAGRPRRRLSPITWTVIVLAVLILIGTGIYILIITRMPDLSPSPIQPMTQPTTEESETPDTQPAGQTSPVSQPARTGR